jgi:hypothetical protein
MLGTLINTLAILIGGSIGLLLHRNLPQRMTRIVFQAIGLFTLVLGVSMALKADETLLVIFSLVLGAIIGEGLRLEERVQSLSDTLQRRLRASHSRFSEGWMTATLLFCVGSMAILGAIEEGLTGDPDLLMAKSVLDGFSSIALAAGMGAGVILSALPLLLYQGGLTLFAGMLEPVFTPHLLNQLTGVGGILLLGLGLNLLEITTIKVLNMLPALLVVVVLSLLFLP